MKHCSRCDQDKPLTDFGKHRGERDGLQRWCKVCRSGHAQEPERKQRKVEYDRQRQIEYADEFRAYNHDRFHNNAAYRERELERARQKKFDPAHRERERLRHYRRWSDPEFRKKSVDRLRNRRHNDPDYRMKVWFWRQERRARIKRQGVPFTFKQWIELCEQYNHRCVCCGLEKPLTRDHVVPVSKGGSSGIENIQPLCIGCNKKKHARHIDYRKGEP